MSIKGNLPTASETCSVGQRAGNQGLRRGQQEGGPSGQLVTSRSTQTSLLGAAGPSPCRSRARGLRSAGLVLTGLPEGCTRSEPIG